MANELKMAEIHAIEQLWKQGWSCRRIARELGLYRGTVGKYVQALEAKPANVTPGISADPSPSAALSASSDPPKPATQVTPGFSRTKSHCEMHREFILAKLELGLSARRIYQDLVAESGPVRGMNLGLDRGARTVFVCVRGHPGRDEPAVSIASPLDLKKRLSTNSVS